jgi:hypothetical protein
MRSDQRTAWVIPRQAARSGPGPDLDREPPFGIGQDRARSGLLPLCAVLARMWQVCHVAWKNDPSGQVPVHAWPELAILAGETG